MVDLRPRRGPKENLIFLQVLGGAEMGRATMSKNRHDQYVFEQFRIDLAERMLTRAEVAIPLPPKGFDLLALLVQNAGNLLEKERIIQALWPGTFVEEANVSNLVGLLRKTLGDSVKRPEYIQTVPKRGYRFVAATVPLEPKPQESRARTEARGQAGIRIIAFPFRSDPTGRRRNRGFGGLRAAIGRLERGIRSTVPIQAGDVIPGGDAGCPSAEPLHAGLSRRLRFVPILRHVPVIEVS